MKDRAPLPKTLSSKGIGKPFRHLSRKLSALDLSKVQVFDNITERIKKLQQQISLIKKQSREKMPSSSLKFSKRARPKDKENVNSQQLIDFVTQISTKLNRDQTSQSSGHYYVTAVCKAVQRCDNNQARQHLQQSHRYLKMLKNLSKPSAYQIQKRKIMLPQVESGKKTVVLDLDQTLVHCLQCSNKGFDAQITIKFPTGSVSKAYLNIRPYAKQLIFKLAQHFEIVIFTASHACYANQVISILDPNNLIKHKFYRESCLPTDKGVFVKDLRVIGGRELSNIILVDNAAYSYILQLDNAIPIINYYSGEDCELKQLQQYLMGLISKDIRTMNRAVFQLDQYQYFESVRELCKGLYRNFMNQ